jgi:hypothetical protein
MLKGDAPRTMLDGATRRPVAVKLPTPVGAPLKAKFQRLGHAR